MFHWGYIASAIGTQCRLQRIIFVNLRVPGREVSVNTEITTDIIVVKKATEYQRSTACWILPLAEYVNWFKQNFECSLY